MVGKRLNLHALCSLLIVSLAVSCSSSDKGEEPTPTPPKEYKLIWADEFDGTSLDLTKWNYEINGSGGGNNELQYYTDSPKNLRVEDGFLIIEARKEQYEGREYTSARITTKGKAEFAYSKIECKLKVPSGKGTWPAFWMLGASWPATSWPRCGEIDIMEHVGSDPTMFSHALHTSKLSGGAAWNKRVHYANAETESHIFTLERIAARADTVPAIPATLKFFIDGEEIAYNTQKSDDVAYWPFNANAFMILNLAIGGNWGGAVDNSIFDSPVLFKVDYIRVYELK